MKHKYYQCNGRCDPFKTHCHYCDGGLASCTVCNGAEGSLTTDCIGQPMTEQQQADAYQGGKDFKDGKWIDRPFWKRKCS